MDARGGGDRVYELLEKGEEGDVGAHFRARDGTGGQEDGGGRGMGKRFPAESERRPRSEEEMRREAEWVRMELERDGIYCTPAAMTPGAETSAAAAVDGSRSTTKDDTGLSGDGMSVLKAMAWALAGGAGAATLFLLGSNMRRVGGGV